MGIKKLISAFVLVLGSIVLLAACQYKHEIKEPKVKYVLVDKAVKEQTAKARSALLFAEDGEIVVLDGSGKPAELCTEAPGENQCAIFKGDIKIHAKNISSISVFEYQVNPNCILICVRGSCYPICW